MNLLLVRANPSTLQNTRLPASLVDEVGCVMPLGIASIAAYVRTHGIAVSIIDAEAECLTQDALLRRMQDLRPDLVGITSMTPTIHDDLAVARLAKKINARTVLGGPHINAMAEETVRLDDVDFGILGEGEYPLLKLIEALEKNSPLKDVPGLVYKESDGSVVLNSPYIHDDLDALPPPARDLLPYDRYFSIISKGRLATISPGRGCPFTCGFCFKQPSDLKIRYRDPAHVVDEIEDVVRRYNVSEINFVSDTLTVRHDFIEALSKLLIARKVKVSWIAPTRADCVTPDLLRIMKRAGCRSLRFGVESGSPEILERMGKKVAHEQMVQAFNWARREGIETFAYFIIGYLGETEETVRETVQFVKRLRPDLIMYNIATPLPGTALFRQAVAAGLVEPDYWQRFLKDKNYPRIPYLWPHAESRIRSAYRRFYFSPRFIMKRLFKLRIHNIRNYIRAARGIVRFQQNDSAVD